MATDALIGTFARTDDPSLRQNVCFLYHLIGGGTGDWDVPIGGMGAVSGALAAAAAGHRRRNRHRRRGLRGSTRTARCATGATVEEPGARALRAGRCHTRRAGRTARRARARLAPGAQVKVNLMLRRLPRLRDETVTPEQAFGGTFHINETLQPARRRLRQAAGGGFPIRCRARSTAIR